MTRESIVYEKAFKFSIRIVKLYQYLCDKKEYILSKQILKSGTSIAANIKEGLYSQSKKDFIHKMNISLKEAAETEYWIELLKETGYITKNMHDDIIEDNCELIKLLVSIVKTSKQNLNDAKET